MRRRRPISCVACKRRAASSGMTGERLQAGQDWHNSLEDEVKKRCGLFLSVISRTTEAARESYYHPGTELGGVTSRAHCPRRGVLHSRRDRRLAACHSTRAAPFQQIQATRLPGGAVTPRFRRTAPRLATQRHERAPMSATPAISWFLGHAGIAVAGPAFLHRGGAVVLLRAQRGAGRPLRTDPRQAARHPFWTVGPGKELACSRPHSSRVSAPRAFCRSSSASITIPTHRPWSLSSSTVCGLPWNPRDTRNKPPP